MTTDAAAGTEDPGLEATDQLALQGHHGNRHMSPDFELRKIGDNIGLIENGKPDVGTITDIAFRSTGGRQPAFSAATTSVRYHIHLITGEDVIRDAADVYHMPADKEEAAAR